MVNEYKPTRDNIFFLCYMVELLCRHTKNYKYKIVENMERGRILEICEYEDVFHSMNPSELIYEQVKELDIKLGRVFREEECTQTIPTVNSFARLYTDLIYKFEGDVIDNFFMVMKSDVNKEIDNFNGTFYYENVDYIAECIRRNDIFYDG